MEEKENIDNLINHTNVCVRAAVAEQGYGLDKLINDKSWFVRIAVAKQGYGLDKLVNDKDCHVRAAVAEQGYKLDTLVNDKSWYVRLAVAEQGYGLDKLINDEYGVVRAVVAKQGYGLDKLINDKDGHVRLAVAEQGYGLDKLINDEDWFVRLAVASQSYGLDILVNDKNYYVKTVAIEMKNKIECQTVITEMETESKNGERKMFKIFISQPMSGLSIEEIKSVRDRAIMDISNMTIAKPGTLELVDDEDIEFIDNLQEDKDPETTTHLQYLSEDVRLLDTADLVYFCIGWEKSRGCNIEYQICREYNIPMMFEL